MGHSSSHQLMTGAAHSVGSLRGVPWQRSVAAGTSITRDTPTVTAVILEGGVVEVKGGDDIIVGVADL